MADRVPYPIARLPLPLPGVSALSGVPAETTFKLRRRLSKDGGVGLTMIVMAVVLIVTLGMVVYKRGRKVLDVRFSIPLTHAEAKAESARRIAQIFVVPAVLVLAVLAIVAAATDGPPWWTLGGVSSPAWLVVAVTVLVVAVVSPSRLQFRFFRAWCIRVHPAFADACEYEIARRTHAQPQGAAAPHGAPQLPSLGELSPLPVPMASPAEPVVPQPEPAPPLHSQPQPVAPQFPPPPPPAPPV